VIYIDNYFYNYFDYNQLGNIIQVSKIKIKKVIEEPNQKLKLIELFISAFVNIIRLNKLK